MNCRNARCILDLNPRTHFPGVDEKLRMRDLCRRIGVPTPQIYGVLLAHSALRHVPRLLAQRDDFVIKPNRGAAGRGVLVVVGREGDGFVRPDGRRVSVHDIRQHMSNILSGLFSLGGQNDRVLIQQRVLSDPAFEPISVQGIADVRIVLYRQVPVMAMLRLPTRASGGRANLHQGGVGAGVELATGLTTRAVLRNRRVDRHPDTGAKLLGFPIPHWEDVLDMARRVSHAVPLGYLGVDIVHDRRQGPLLLEANARPGLAIQLANGAGLLPRFAEVDRQLAMHETAEKAITTRAAVAPQSSLTQAGTRP
jgi:alpha-L-glutamate ligase-like protein